MITDSERRRLDEELGQGREFERLEEENRNLRAIMAKVATLDLSTVEWRTDEIPAFLENRLALVVLREDCGLEHYGPVLVHVWPSKLKTTVEPIRIEREQVLKWALVDP